MYRLLIIDDEEPVRKSIRIAGRWDDLQVSELYEATDGKMGLQSLLDHTPDIVLLDLQMPILHGIDFLKEATHLSPNTKYIIVSSYEDFQYAKQAISLGIMGYLLKPIDRQQLNQTLEKAIYALAKEKVVRDESIALKITGNLSVPLFKEKFFTSLIERVNLNASTLKMYTEITNLHMNLDRYGVILFRFANLNEVCEQRFMNDKYICFYAITNIINEMCSLLGEGFSFRSPKSAHEVITVIGLSTHNRVEQSEAVFPKIKAVVEKLGELLDFYVIASIGEFQENIGNLASSYEDAEKIITSVNILEPHDYVYTRKIDGRKSTTITPLSDKRAQLHRALETGSTELAASIIHEYFEAIKQAGYFSVDNANKVFLELIMMLEEIAHQLVGDVEHVSELIEANKCIPAFAKFDEFSIYVKEFVVSMSLVVREKMKPAESVNIQEIKDYIDEHYYQVISLTSLSERWYLSKEYLSRKFKDRFGSGIYEYVLKVRMERAKALLDVPNYKIQDVSDHVGYNDNNYFSKAFKKFYGISPTEYRDSRN